MGAVHAAVGAKTTVVRAAAAKDTANPVIKVLALNDFHGALESPGTYKASGGATPVPAGGVDEIAGYIAAARAANPNTVVVVYGGVPQLLLEVDDLSAYNVGYLIYFFWRAVACSGYLLGVNPFNQPGVESYKKNMFALLGKPGYENLTAELEAKLK